MRGKNCVGKWCLRRFLVCYRSIECCTLFGVGAYVQLKYIRCITTDVFMATSCILFPYAILRVCCVCVSAACVCVLVGIHTLCVDSMDIRISITVYDLAWPNKYFHSQFDCFGSQFQLAWTNTCENPRKLPNLQIFDILAVKNCIQSNPFKSRKSIFRGQTST